MSAIELVSPYLKIKHRRVSPLRGVVGYASEAEQKQRWKEANDRLNPTPPKPKPMPLLAPLPPVVKEPVPRLPKIVMPHEKSMAMIEEIAQKHGVSVVNVIGRSQSRAVCLVRDECFYQIRLKTNLSLPQIGRLFGGRDHSSVFWGLKRHALRNGLFVPEIKPTRKYTPDEVLSIISLRWLSQSYEKIAKMKGLSVNQVVGVVKRWNIEHGRVK